MKLAFLLMADKDPLQFGSLLKALDDPRFDFFVHIDAKSDIAPFQKEGEKLQRSRIFFLSNRQRIYWGDISMVEAMLVLYQNAMEQDNYSRFVLLSGCDYPIASNDKIWETLSAPEKEYIIASPLAPEKQQRVERTWVWKMPSKRLFWLINRASRYAKKKRYVTVQGEKWPVYTGSQWTALSRECVAYVLDLVKQNRSLMRYFRYSYAPDELLIPTVVANSRIFSAKAVHVAREEWLSFNELPAVHHLRYESQPGSTVRIFDETELDEILASGKLFVRKLWSGKSDALREQLDAVRGRKCGEQ